MQGDRRGGGAKTQDIDDTCWPHSRSGGTEDPGAAKREGEGEVVGGGR